MKVFNLNNQITHQELSHPAQKPKSYLVVLLLGLLMLFWPFAQRVVSWSDPTMGIIDPNIWLLVLLSLIVFLVIVGMCWWLLQRFWTSLGLPALDLMVTQFNGLTSWQQLGFYWASFGLLLFAAIMVLTAIV